MKTSPSGGVFSLTKSSPCRFIRVENRRLILPWFMVCWEENDKQLPGRLPKFHDKWAANCDRSLSSLSPPHQTRCGDSHPNNLQRLHSPRPAVQQRYFARYKEFVPVH